MKHATKVRLLTVLGVALARAIIATMRIRIHDHSGMLADPRQPPCIWLFWHNRLFLVPHMFEKLVKGRRGAALTSASKDGDYLAGYIARFGIRAVRGSSSRGGVAALLQMKSLLDEGCDVAFTPDGPRGPRYHLHPGVVLLAQKTGVPVMLVNVEYTRSWRMGRWDGFFLPKPFSRADFTFGQQLHVPKTSTPEEFEAQRARLEAALNEYLVEK